MNRRRVAIAFVLAMFAVSTARAAQEQVRIPSTGADGVQIEVDITVNWPDNLGAGCPEKVPVVLNSHGWGGSKSNGTFSSYLDACMGVVSISQRGFGSSGGEANVEDLDYEGEDFQAVLDYIATLPWVAMNDEDSDCDVDDPDGEIQNDPVLGAEGGSYGGGYQWATAFADLLDYGCTRMDALSPDISWYDLPNALAPEGVVRTVWVTALYAEGASALPQYVHEAFAWGLVLGYFPDGTIQGQEDPSGLVPDLESEFREHGPVGYREITGLQLDIPVYLTQGMPDNLFNLNQGIHNMLDTLTPEARAKSILIGHNGGHVLPQVFPLTLPGGSDTCAPTGSWGSLRIPFFEAVFSGQNPKDVLDDVATFNFTPVGASDDCLRTEDVAPDTSFPVGPIEVVVSPSMVGAPIHLPLADGPLNVAGIPTISGDLTTAGADVRVFFGLSMGTTPADATVIQNNVLPIRSTLPSVQAPGEWELPGIAVRVPEGQQLFLTVSAAADQFAGMGSRTPGVLILENARVNVNVVD